MQKGTEGFQRAIADFVCFHCPLVASAEAKPLQQLAEEVCKCAQLNRERDSKSSALYSHPAYAPTAPNRLMQNPITISGTFNTDVRPLGGFSARIATYTHGSMSSR